MKIYFTRRSSEKYRSGCIYETTSLWKYFTILLFTREEYLSVKLNKTLFKWNEFIQTPD